MSFFHHIRLCNYFNKLRATKQNSQFLNHKKGNKNLRLKDTCTEKLRIKHGFGLIMDEFHNFRYEHLWNHDFFAQELNIIFDIIDIFFRYFFDIISIFVSMFPMFFSIFFFD